MYVLRKSNCFKFLVLMENLMMRVEKVLQNTNYLIQLCTDNDSVPKTIREFEVATTKEKVEILEEELNEDAKLKEMVSSINFYYIISLTIFLTGDLFLHNWRKRLDGPCKKNFMQFNDQSISNKVQLVRKK